MKRISLSRDIVLFYSYNLERPESLDTIKRLLVNHITRLRNGGLLRTKGMH